MKKIILVLTVLTATIVQQATAGSWSVNGSISTGIVSSYSGRAYAPVPVYSYAPGCYSGPTYVYAPAPAVVYVPPPSPVYYAPPAPVVFYQPAGIAPAPVIGINLSSGGGHHRRGW
jgi:hypothetical protein